MELGQRSEQGVTVLTVTGRLDAVTAADFEARTRSVIATGAPRLVLDLAALEYVSSAGLRALLVTAKQVHAAGGRILFANVHGTVHSVFAMSGFATMFELTDSVDHAVAALS
jgi:anti-anti-sigma factor